MEEKYEAINEEIINKNGVLTQLKIIQLKLNMLKVKISESVSTEELKEIFTDAIISLSQLKIIYGFDTEEIVDLIKNKLDEESEKL